MNLVVKAMSQWINTLFTEILWDVRVQVRWGGGCREYSSKIAALPESGSVWLEPPAMSCAGPAWWREESGDEEIHYLRRVGRSSRTGWAEVDVYCQHKDNSWVVVWVRFERETRERRGENQEPVEPLESIRRWILRSNMLKEQLGW